MSDYSEIHKEMGTNHADFLRLLPRSVPSADISWQGDEASGCRIIIEKAPTGRIEIDLSPVGVRQIALLKLPTTHVTFRFYGMSPQQAEAEHARMAKHFQRGGG